MKKYIKPRDEWLVADRTAGFTYFETNESYYTQSALPEIRRLQWGKYNKSVTDALGLLYGYCHVEDETKREKVHGFTKIEYRAVGYKLLDFNSMSEDIKRLVT